MIKRKKFHLPVIEIISFMCFLGFLAFIVSMSFSGCISSNDALIICVSVTVFFSIYSLTGYIFSICHDSTTDVFNDRYFFNYCRFLKLWGLLKNYSAVFINIKDFKLINNKYGAPYGDDVLKEYAVYVNNKLSFDEPVCHIGGDNFVILFRKEKEEFVLKTINNISVSINVEGNNVQVPLRVRAGIYCIRENDSISEVMNGTTVALSEARKHRDRDVVRFETYMYEEILRIKSLVSCFDSALSSNRFEIYYQPKVDIASGKIVGAEALARWNRNGFIVEPKDFVSVLEKEYLITKLDYYVFKKVCEDISGWISKGLVPVRVSANFSKINLQNPSFSQDIFDMVKSSGVDPSYIEIELTESSGYENYEQLSDFVRAMHNGGISVSIDDFGTGYSSLSLIKHINPDMIKLDKSFLSSDSESSFVDFAIIKNLVNMINEIGSRVICEGVETEAQASLLLKAGCKLAQGFLYSRPMLQKDFEVQLNDRL